MDVNALVAKLLEGTVPSYVKQFNDKAQALFDEQLNAFKSEVSSQVPADSVVQSIVNELIAQLNSLLTASLENIVSSFADQVNVLASQAGSDDITNLVEGSLDTAANEAVDSMLTTLGDKLQEISNNNLQGVVPVVEDTTESVVEPVEPVVEAVQPVAEEVVSQVGDASRGVRAIARPNRPPTTRQVRSNRQSVNLKGGAGGR